MCACNWCILSLFVLAWDVHHYSYKVQGLIQAVAVSLRKSQATKSIGSLTSEVYVMLISSLFYWIWSSPLSFSYQTIHSNLSFQISWWGLSYCYALHDRLKWLFYVPFAGENNTKSLEAMVSLKLTFNSTMYFHCTILYWSFGTQIYSPASSTNQFNKR